MSFKTLIWKNLRTRIWLFVSSITLVLVFIVTMLATQVPLFYGTLKLLWGKERAETGESRNLYEADYADKESVLAAANAFNIEIASEGITLLKNEGNTLPLAKSTRISVFGKNSVNLLYGGSGSGAGNAGDLKSVFASLTDAGLTYNTTLESFYKNNSQSGNGRKDSPGFSDIIAGFGTGETPIANYINNNIPDSYGADDAALVILTRIGGEGFDLPRTMAESYINTGIGGALNSGERSKNDHYLELDKNEADLLQHVCSNFNKVIVVINSNNSIEMGFLDDPSYWTDVLGLPDQSSKIQAALWIGSPGAHGIMALGKILSGDINPSGRTVDIHVRDFTQDPTYNNFGNNSKDNGNAYFIGGTLPGKATDRYYYNDYEEGIYVGYRYYETRGYTEGETWYGNNVVYPLGHGLSYSQFEWSLGDARLVDNKQGTVTALPAALTAADANKTIEIDVNVKNKSDSSKPGKDVVQLYVKTPYTDGGIEKAHVVLSDFAKTDILVPGGESQTVTLSVSLYSLASYDYNDANGNGFKGFETEASAYKLYISRDAHSWKDGSAFTREFTVPQTQSGASKGSTGFQYRKDQVTGNDVVNRYSDASGEYAVSGRSGENDMNYLSRSGWTPWPATPTNQDRIVTQAFANAMTYVKNDAGKPWYSEDTPNQSARELSKEAATVQFEALVGKDYDDPLWEEFLDQLTLKQMCDLTGIGAFETKGIQALGVPVTTSNDGPSGWTNFIAQSDKLPVYSTCFYASSYLVGSTYNKKLAYEMGRMLGNEALVGDEKGDGLPYTGWYAPGINIHRSQFSGRNWEYYSEDPVLSGKMAAEVIQGAKEKGVYTCVKHFAVNDMETNRDSNGLLVWLNEQSMREIYLRPFELAVKEGKTTGIMSSFNRIGTVWTGGDYRLLTEILRNEWGFRGLVITDYASDYMNFEQQIRAGGDLRLYQSYNISTDYSPTQITAIRKAAHNVLFTVVNSNAMNIEQIGSLPPYWVIALIWINIGLLIAFLAWGAVAIILSYKKTKSSQASPKV